MSKQQTADDLRAAARYIEEHGWTRFYLEADDGSVCAAGSLQKVAGFSHEDVEEDISPLLEGAAIRYGEDAYVLVLYLRNVLHVKTGIGGWNDCRGRTKEEVMETLEKAAAWFEEQA